MAGYAINQLVHCSSTKGAQSTLIHSIHRAGNVCDKLSARAGHRGIRAARAQYDAWRAIVEKAQWKRPEDVKKAHPKASILKGSRVVFNIKGNDYRLIAVVQYADGVLMIRFFGSHEDYDKVDAESV